MKYTITYGSSQEVGLIGKGRFTEKKPFLITMFGRGVKHIVTCFVAIMLCLNIARAQEEDFKVMLNFKVNSYELDTAYGRNAEELKKFDHFVQTLKNDTLTRITRIELSGAASPEGSFIKNQRLAHRRILCLEKLIRSKVSINDTIICYNDSLIHWNKLKAMVDYSFPEQYKDTLQSVILSRMDQLDNMYNDSIAMNVIKRMYKGKVYQVLVNHYLPDMRNACAVFLLLHKPQPKVVEGILQPTIVEVKPQPAETDTLIHNEVDSIPQSGVVMSTVESWQPKWYIKTNAVALAFVISNVAAELDVANHWSVTLPVYYSAWNYFSHKVKFRTLAIQPEVRYWFSEESDGLFAGAHLGLAYYNFATGGDYRTQDHSRETPAWGGGLSIGYRLPLSRNSRWKMEFSVGAGVYPAKYDKFINGHNGLLAYTDRKTYVGLDQLNISIAYTFDTFRKGGKR